MSTCEFADLTQVPNVDVECRLNCSYLSYDFGFWIQKYTFNASVQQIILWVEMLQQTFWYSQDDHKY